MKHKDQLSRMLAILPMAQSGELLTTSSLAKTFGITKRQVLKDLATLFMCGLPGGYPDDLIEIDMDAAREDGIVRLSNAEYLTRPLRLTIDEAMSLQAALTVVRESATGAQAAAADSALAKLEQITGTDSGVHVEIASGTEEVRAQLSQAIAGKQRLKLVYDGASRAVTTQPVIDPVQIQIRDGVAYLQAWSIEADAWRVYRLDRVVSIEAIDEAAVDHGNPPSGDWFEQDKDVELLLAPEATWICEYHPCEIVEKRPDGSVLARFKVASPAWLTAMLLRLGGSVRVSDKRFAADALAAARQTLEMYENLRIQ